MMADGTELMMTMISMISTMWPPQANVSDGAIFDYIVIGSGAGAVIANRLSEDPNISVLMIEAGDNPTDDSRIVAQFASLPKTPMDWNFTSEAEPASVSQELGKFSIANGKVLGGSSCIGHPVYLRGDTTDFNKWAEELNDPSWSYENVLKYFKKIENMKDQSIMAEYGEYHSTTGFMNITTQPSERASRYMDAFAEIGHKINPDMNANDMMGIGLGQYNADIVRQDVGAAYILSASDRPNYHVLKNTFVTKVIIKNSKAVGVEAVLDNNKITILAKKEIIVSAGVVNSPKLLCLSGIGPKNVLKKYLIPVIADLPVGENLQEHPAVAFAFKMDRSSAPNSEVLPYGIPFDMILLAASVTGKAPPEYQATCLLLEHDTIFLQAACSVIFGIKTETCTNFVNESVGRDVMFCLIAKFQPKSRGSVTIQSADPFVDPKIHLNIYGEESDFTDMLSYMDDFMRILNSTYFKNAEAEVIKPELKDCTDTYWSCYAKKHTVNMFHPVGTCAMGSVVDSKARVFGVSNLRVVDSSSLMRIPRANNMAALLMSSEKHADDIKQSA